MTPVDDRPGIGGWLLVLSRLLILWQPVIIGLMIAQALGGLSMRAWSVTALVLARGMAAALGVGAGLALKRRHQGAVRFTQVSLLVSAAIETLVYLTPSYPSARAPGETPLWVLGTLAFYGAWYGYLARSKRVRATFYGSNASDAAP